MMFLKDEIEKERRKSLADEQKIRKLEGVMDSNARKMEEQIR